MKPAPAISDIVQFCHVLPEASLLVHPDGGILVVNRAASKLFGAQQAGLQRVHDLVEDTREAVDRFLHQCTRTRELVPASLVFRTSGGPVRCRMQGAVAIASNESHAAVIFLRAVPEASANARFRELNARIQNLNAEVLHRRRAEAKLHAQREWLRTTLASIGDAVIATDRQGRIAFMNSVAEALTGWTADDACERPVDDVFVIVNEGTREPVENPIEQVLAHGHIVGLANHTVLLAKDGVERPIDDSGAPIRDETGDLMGAVLVFRDISERRRTEQEILRANRRLSRSNDSLRQFAYAAAHDLREPLRTVALYSQMAARSITPDASDDLREFLGHVNAGAVRMDALVRDLFTFIEAADTLERQPAVLVDCGVALQQALSNLTAAIQESGAVITHDELPVVAAHASPLMQVFQNLIGNSLKYRLADVPPRVHVNASLNGTEWTFRVKDNGIGIDPRYHRTVFGVFKRLERSGSGTGIGLAICERVVDQYGGRIWVESELGHGATFAFTLPLALPD